MTAQETSLTIGKRVRGRTHLAKIRICPDMKLANQIQIIVEHIIKIPALLSRFRQNHGQMQGDRSHVKSAYKDGRILLVSRMHPAPLIPRGKKRAASHRGNHLAILLIHAGNISLPCQAQPIGIHRLCGTPHTRFKHVLQLLAGTVQILVIQKYNLREKHGFLAFLLPLPLPAHVEHLNRRHLREAACADSGSHRDERIIAATACHRIKLIFPALKALLKLFLHIRQRFRLRRLLVNSQLFIFRYISLVGFLRIRL